MCFNVMDVERAPRNHWRRRQAGATARRLFLRAVVLECTFFDAAYGNEG
jgi:hypothetical protein